MGAVIMNNVVSVDGFIDDGDQQFDHSGSGGRIKVSALRRSTSGRSGRGSARS
jgi:hypothetical protein